MDKDGGLHRGITTIPIPFLKGDPKRIKQIREDLLKKEDQELFWVDFCDTAQQSKTYEEYKSLLKNGYRIVGVIPDASGPGKPDILMAKRI